MLRRDRSEERPGPAVAQPWLCIAVFEKKHSYMAVFNNDTMKRIDRDSGMGFLTSFSC